MPYPNEHACRLKAPGQFPIIRREPKPRDHKGKAYYVIYGKKSAASPMQEQAYRYPKDKWNAASAQAHCEAHKGMAFEAASEKATGGGGFSFGFYRMAAGR
jgi:hypothetical protein